METQQRLAVVIAHTIDTAVAIALSPQGLDDIARDGLALDAAEQLVREL